ncbi:MFS transporter [Cupriavidus sp. 8B]
MRHSPSTRPTDAALIGEYQPTNQTAIDIGAVRDGASLNRFHVALVSLCAGVMFFDGFDLLTISFAATAIAKEFGLSAQQMGFVFSAGLLGLAVGGLTQGPFSDRLGRKPVLIVCVLLFSAGTWATALATSFHALLALRFVAGLGLGGATPVVFTLVTDNCPKRIRASLSMVMYCGLMVGGVAGGAITAAITPAVGWQGVFHIGGILPLFYMPVLLYFLPESLEFLALKSRRTDEVTALLKQLAPGFKPVQDTRYVSAASGAVKGSVIALFQGHLRARTWTAALGFFCTMLSLYFYASWLPALMRGIGLSEGQSITITMSGQIGNLLGSLVIARLIISWPPYRVITVTYFGAAAALLAVSMTGPELYWQLTFNFLVGACLSGSLNGFMSMAPQLYPAELRATGTGCVRSVGYIGAVLGPGVAGALMADHWSTGGLFQLASVPPIVAAATCVILPFLMEGQRFPSRAVNQATVGRAHDMSPNG